MQGGTETTHGTAKTHQYDAWGRNTGYTSGLNRQVYAYGYGDKIKTSTYYDNYNNPPTSTAGYEYDGLGKRRKQAVGAARTWFRWNGMEEAGEYGAGANEWTPGALNTTYIPGLAMLAGSSPATAEYRYLLNDHLGSPRRILGQTKAAMARYDFAPYGELMRNAGLPLTVGYTGHRWDPNMGPTGQYFAPYRYYNPQNARWNMRDPLGMVDGPNVYAYVAGNPVMYIDAYGLCWIDNVQTGLDLAGFVPGLGMVPDGANALISLGRGNYGEAAASALAMIPGIGDGAAALKLGAKAAKKGRSSAGKLAKELERGRAPKGIDRFDGPHVDGQKDHVHYDDGTSRNWDGTPHDKSRGTPNPGNKTKNWLKDHGWLC